MHSLSILIISAFFVVVIQSRPSQTDENETDLEEAVYVEEDKAVAYDSSNSDSSIDEDSGRGTDEGGRVQDSNKYTYSYEQKPLAQSIADGTRTDVSDYKPDREIGDQENNDKTEETNNNYDDQNYAKRQQSKYTENKDATDQQEAAQHLTNRNVNYYKNSRNTNSLLSEDPTNKREVSVKATPNEQGEMLFGSEDQANQEDEKYLHNEPLESNQRYAKYYTQMHSENKELTPHKRSEGDRLFFNRNRRESKVSNENTASKIEANKDLDKNQNEDEELAIRKHIKKLSNEELEELLSSLTEEKRELLKTIIEDTDLTDSNDSVIKREITKKAGALEENTCIQSGLADSNINEESSAAGASTELPEQMSDVVEQNKQSANTLLFNAKSIETNSSNKIAILNQQDDTVQQKTNADTSEVGAEKTPAQIVPIKQVSKNEKRETNIDDLADIVSFEDPKTMESDWLTGDSKDQQGYSQEEDLSQFLDDEQAVANDDSKVYKRDLQKQADYDAKYKSLEESFPKSTNYDESAGPLIRVKRKNEPVMKKRSAVMVPEAKVGFFPYRAENDEDNEEGNEFDDDGFYDRTPNFSSDEVNKPNIRDVSSCKLNEKDSRLSSNDISKGTMTLGSDTDSVLSGVEGVDETLMFSSGSRNRRTSEETSDVMDESNSIHNSKSLSDESKAVSDMNALTFKENDSFGPLPRNNDGESGRYKRIRRVKQSHPENISSES